MTELFRKYKTKPVEIEEIEAVELTEDNIDEIMKEINASGPENGFECANWGDEWGLAINNGENTMLAKIGDMIVREGPLPWYTPWKKKKFEEYYKEVS